MKKILSVLCIATLLFASCSDEYDDSKLWQNVNDLKDRIASLEKTVQTMNSDINSIQSIVDAINARDYIVKVEELADKSGYTITFAKGNTVTIKHGTNGINGTNGQSAYELAVSKGYRGTLDEWLESLNGTNGSNGKSAYELAVENGYTGTEQEWLESLKGIDGKDSPIIGIDIYEGVYYWTITTNGNKTWLLDNDGNKLKVSGVDGKTAYDLAVEKGYKGTLEEWLESLKGSDGQNGSDGKSAYELAVEKGYTGTLEEWLLSLNGTNGSDGKSAYELAVEKGYEGTLDEWLESLKGSNGSDGQDGSNGKSAYELAVEKGYSGTIEEWLESLNGTDGKDGSDGSDGSDGENGKDGITPILGVDSEGYWTIDMGNGVQRLKDANGEDVKAIGQDGTDGKDGQNGQDGKDGVDGSSFFNNVRYDDNFVYFTFTDGKTVSIPLSKGVSFTVTGVSVEQSFEYGETRTFDIVQNNIAKISISKPDGWKVSVQSNVLTVIAPPQENTFAEESGEIAITAMGTDSKSFIMFSFAVKIDMSNIHFEDSKFKEYILANFDKDGNGSISQSEANEITEIDCSGLGISSIAEIKNFPNLVSLNCSNNSIAELDLTGNLLLETLDCSNNKLTSLDIFVNTKITSLNTIGNSIDKIRVWDEFDEYDSNYKKDESTIWDRNNILFKDANFKSYLLMNFDLDGDGEISKNEANEVTAININGKSVSDVSGIEYFTNLTSFDCSNNQITKLDVSKNTSLQTLSCYGNDLQLLDFSNCKNLTTIYLLENGKNVITDNSSSIEESYMMTIDKSSYSNLVLSFANTQILQLNCTNNESLQSIDIGKNDQLAIMRIESNPLLEILDVTKNSKLEILYCTNNKLSGLDVFQNPILSTLDCSGNEIPQLDVMNNPQLTSLDCSSNQIGSLNLSKNTLLTTVNCSSNQLQGLIVRNNVALVDLNCSNNQLTVLDVTKNTELEKLNCSNNNLSTLDLRQNTKLTSLDCSGNENLAVINIMTNWNLTNVRIIKHPQTQLMDDENKRHYCIGDYYCFGNKEGVIIQVDKDGFHGRYIELTESKVKGYRYSGNMSKQDCELINFNLNLLNKTLEKLQQPIIEGEYWTTKTVSYGELEYRDTFIAGSWLSNSHCITGISSYSGSLKQRSCGSF